MSKMERVASVSQINTYLKNVMDSDEILRSIWIRGEISNFKLHYSGHMYLSLKDEFSNIRAVMFKGAGASLRFTPENGMSVLAYGRISVYERDGQYQLYIEQMKPEGAGDLHTAFEQLKEKLQKEGLFDEQRKKPLPKYPDCIGVITSATGAAVRDILNILSRRYPAASVKLLPVPVQGAGAAAQIAAAIEYFNKKPLADVLIVGRGGGSIEDLWAFNEETTVRAVAASRIPVISAVGHETDFTICDFAADLRAPTPSAAAELAVPDMAETLKGLESRGAYLAKGLEGKLKYNIQRLEGLESLLSVKRFTARLDDEQQAIDYKQTALEKAVAGRIETFENKMRLKASALDALSPLKVLSRGFSVTLDESGRPLKNSRGTKKGGKIKVILEKGRVYATVDEIEES